MQIKGSVALVTGANRGIGKAFTRALAAAGAAKIYAAARDPASIAGPGLHVLKLDITHQSCIADAAEKCRDVSLLINNAGIATFSPLIGATSMDAARAEMETNYFGTLAMCRAFAPVLRRNGGGALVNILSVVSWINVPMQGSYSASKSAEWSLTNGIRVELRDQGTLVIGVHVGYVETDMTAHLDVPKTRPEQVAERTLEAIEAGREEVLADQRAQDLKRALAADPVSVDAAIRRSWDARPR
jgi:NAD(P)-dependent dehydrogenase (short-subunit alcohol dehydrogenase family)